MACLYFMKKGRILKRRSPLWRYCDDPEQSEALSMTNKTLCSTRTTST
ncbi:MAG: hypothetical protein L0Y68_05645 [Candidatus Dadabacteria bacterium]|nr:hypothetical protein [Candidatus Dadabacteria bacterium]